MADDFINMTEKEILLTSILNCSRSALYSQDWTLNDAQEKRLSEALSLRSQGVPLQYILGEVEFFGLLFKVDKRVLIPRPETEILVEAVINLATPASGGAGSHLKILDIGTGSGCIAVSLAKSLPEVQIDALDVSLEALVLAKENAVKNCVDERINFVQSDFFFVSNENNANNCLGSYDIIISNPPYLRSCDIAQLPREVRFEPRIALDGGNDGLDFYRGIIQESAKSLKKGGFLFFEIGFSQRKGIEEIIGRQDTMRLSEVRKDYSGIERVIVLVYG